MLPRGTSASRAMSASEVAANPFWYAKPTAALTSRDRLSICVLAMHISPSSNLDTTGGQTCQAVRLAFGQPRSLILTYPVGQSPLYEAHLIAMLTSVFQAYDRPIGSFVSK